MRAEYDAGKQSAELTAGSTSFQKSSSMSRTKKVAIAVVEVVVLAAVIAIIIAVYFGAFHSKQVTSTAYRCTNSAD